MAHVHALPLETRQDRRFTRHRGPVTCATCVPKRARTIISAGYDGAVGISDAHTRRVALIGYHDHLVNRVSVSPSGRLAASASSDHTINLWDIPERRLLRRLRGHSDDVEDFAFIDEAIGVSASRDRRALLWDLTSGAVLRAFVGHERDVLSVAYANGQLFTSGDDMTLRVWSVETGQAIRQWGPFAYETDTCAVDPVRNRVILGCDDGLLRVFDIATGSPVGEIDAHRSGIKVVAVSPLTGDILSAAYDRRVIIWDGATLEMRLELAPIATVWERSFNWSPDGELIVAGTFDGTVVGWSAKTGRQRFEIGDAEGNPCLNDVCAAGDDLAATVADDGYVRLGELSDAGSQWVARAAPADGRVLANAVTAHAEQGVIVAGGHDGVLRTFSLGPNLCQSSAVDLGHGPINCVRLLMTRAGYEIFAACYSGFVVRLTAEGEILANWRAHDGAVKALRLVAARGLGVSCSADGTATGWSLESGERRMAFPGHTAIVNDLDVDPRGNMLATVGRDFALNVYALSSARLLQRIALERRSPKAVLFASEQTILVGDYWGYLVFVPLDGAPHTRLRAAANGVSSLARRPDGRVVASSYDGSLLLIDVAARRVTRILHAMRQRVTHPAIA